MELKNVSSSATGSICVTKNHEVQLISHALNQIVASLTDGFCWERPCQR